MSVIQDALRRKLEEQRRAEDQGPPPREPVKAPPQTPPLAQQVLQRERPAIQPRPSRPVTPAERYIDHGGQPGRSDPWTIRLLVIVILLMLTAGLVGVILFAVRSESPQVAQPAAPPAAPTPEPATVAAPAPPVPPPELVPEPAPAPVVQPAPVPVDETAWPDIQVGGVMAASVPRTSSAMLNETLTRMNRKIDGVKLVGVTDEGVTLEWQGSRRFVEIGTGTLD